MPGRKNVSTWKNWKESFHTWKRRLAFVTRMGHWGESPLGHAYGALGRVTPRPCSPTRCSSVIKTFTCHVHRIDDWLTKTDY